MVLDQGEVVEIGLARRADGRRRPVPRPVQAAGRALRHRPMSGDRDDGNDPGSTVPGSQRRLLNGQLVGATPGLVARTEADAVRSMAPAVAASEVGHRAELGDRWGLVWSCPPPVSVCYSAADTRREPGLRTDSARPRWPTLCQLSRGRQPGLSHRLPSTCRRRRSPATPTAAAPPSVAAGARRATPAAAPRGRRARGRHPSPVQSVGELPGVDAPCSSW